MDPIFGPIIGAGISAISSLFGGGQSQRAANSIAQQNIQQQQNFAMHGLDWRAKDARAAEADTGINALALLGAPTASFSNIVGGDGGGQATAQAGQDIGRAIAAASSVDERAAELNQRLVQAKIDNVNADTVRMLHESSAAARVNAPGTPPPLPPEDPRGPVIPLMQRARDPRTGEILWIPSEKAASPLQTLAALPTNAALAGRGATEGLIGFDGSNVSWGLPSWLPLRRDAWRGFDNTQWTPF